MSNVAKLITGLLKPAKLLEDTILTLIAQRNLNDAEGVQLTQLGELVGQPRNGITDDTLYVRYVAARILANRSDGQPETIYRIVRTVLGETAHTLRLLNEGAAAFTMRIEALALDWDVATAIVTFLRKGESGGVRAILEWTLEEPDDAFTFADGDDYEDGANGFADDVLRLDMDAETPLLTTDLDPWDAILAAQSGSPSPVLLIDIVAAASLPLEVRDGERWDGAAWVAAANTVGVTLDNETGVTVADIEAEITASSAWVQVLTPGTQPAAEIVLGQTLQKAFVGAGGSLASAME